MGNVTGSSSSTGANTHGCPPQSQYQRSNSENSGNPGPNNRPSQSSRHANYNFDYRESQRQPHARFDERYNQKYSPTVFPLTPSLNSSFPETLSRSLLQIAENQSRTIDTKKASQDAEATAYKEMAKTNKMRDDDALFHSIGVYDGSNHMKFEKWIDSIDQATHITGRDLRKELLKKSDGVIRNTQSMMDDRWTDDAIIAKLHQDFSPLSTMNRAREELKNLFQEPSELITVFIYKYGQMHYLSTGIRAHRERHPFAITGFITALEPKFNKMVVRKYADARDKPDTLEAIFQMAEWCSKKMLEADSFDCSNTFRVPFTINEISEADVNEVTQAHWSNTGNYNNKHGGKYGDKQNHYIGKKDFDKKPWQNKDQKLWNKDHKSWYGNKESKPKDVCIKITKDVNYFCPTGFDEGIFNAVTKLLHEKVEQAKRAGSDYAKTVNTIECEKFCNFFKIPEQFYDTAFMQVISELTPKISGNDTD